MSANDREALLKRYGGWYGERRFAIAWTNTNDPARGDPKKVTTSLSEMMLYCFSQLMS